MARSSNRVTRPPDKYGDLPPEATVEEIPIDPPAPDPFTAGDEYSADEADRAVDEGVSYDSLQSALRSEADDSVDYIDAVGRDRGKAAEYYLGKPFGLEVTGRSKIVSRDVHDSVQAMMPSLMRIFFGGDKQVEFIPTRPEAEAAAKLATEYVQYIFCQENPGFDICYAAFKDALIRKTGVFKWWWETRAEVTVHELEGIDEATLMALENDPEVEIVSVDIEESMDEMPGMEGMGETGMPGTGAMNETAVAPGLDSAESLSPRTPLAPGMDASAVSLFPELQRTINVEFRRTVEVSKAMLGAVPPEEFLVSRGGRTLEEASFVGHQVWRYASDLIAEGYPEEAVQKHQSASDESYDRFDEDGQQSRNKFFYDYTGVDRNDDAGQMVYVCESYLRFDLDGDGLAEQLKIVSFGDEYDIVTVDSVTEIPFATLCPDPEPHTIIGRSTADDTMDIQLWKSQVLRDMLDSLGQSIFPRVVYVEGQVNVEDVLNNEVGAPIRAQAPGMVQELPQTFVGQQAFPMLQYADQVKEARTGISKASMGLNADALQSSTRAAVDATVQGAQGRIELIARIFAETGMKRMMRGLLRLIVENQASPRQVYMGGRWAEVDPGQWDAEMDLRVNVALSASSTAEKTANLMTILAKQEEILLKLGPVNPLVDMSQYFDTLARLVVQAGYANPSVFFKDPAKATPEQQQQYQQAFAAQNQNGVEEANKQLAAAEMQKAQAETAKVMADAAKAKADIELDRSKLILDDDRERDKMHGDWIVQMAEMQAKYGAQFDGVTAVAMIKAETERKRNTQQQQQPLRPVG